MDELGSELGSNVEILRVGTLQSEELKSRLESNEFGSNSENFMGDRIVIKVDDIYELIMSQEVSINRRATYVATGQY